MERVSVKKISSNLLKIAKQLPAQFDEQVAKCILTGEDIHLSGLNTEGIENDGTEYTLTIPIYILRNHRRNLSKAYKKKGIVGISEYVDKCFDEHE